MLSDDQISDVMRRMGPPAMGPAGFAASAVGDGEDLLHDALIKALVLQRDGTEIRSLPAWLHVAVANLRRDVWRRADAERRALERLAQRARAERAEHDPWTPCLDPSVEAALAALPSRQREVVVLHYLVDVSVNDIAERLGISAGTVKSTLSRARQSIARSLRAEPAAAIAAPTSQEQTMEEVDRGQILGWILAGSHREEYAHGVLDGDRFDGHRVAFLRFTADAEPSGFGTVMQTFDARHHRASRLRFSGHLRTEAAGWAGLWMRVDERDGRFSAFDNMQDRSMSGDRDWSRCEVVLDVGADSSAVAFGILLCGAGEARFAGLRLETVGEDVPTTGVRLAAAPQNLDFSAS